MKRNGEKLARLSILFILFLTVRLISRFEVRP